MSRKDKILDEFISNCTNDNMIKDLNRMRSSIIDVDVDIINSMVGSYLKYKIIIGMTVYNNIITLSYIDGDSIYSKSFEIIFYKKYNQLLRKKKLSNVLDENY